MAGSREGLVRSEFIFISQCVAAVHDKVVCFVLFPKDLFLFKYYSNCEICLFISWLWDVTNFIIVIFFPLNDACGISVLNWMKIRFYNMMKFYSILLRKLIIFHLYFAFFHEGILIVCCKRVRVCLFKWVFLRFCNFWCMILFYDEIVFLRSLIKCNILTKYILTPIASNAILLCYES